MFCRSPSSNTFITYLVFNVIYLYNYLVTLEKPIEGLPVSGSTDANCHIIKIIVT